MNSAIKISLFSLGICSANVIAAPIVPVCDPLPEEFGVAGVLTTPATSLMNLAPLYTEELSGDGQLAAVIEHKGISHIPSDLEGKVVNSLTPLKRQSSSDHQASVARVIASQSPKSIAPNAQLFLGAPQAQIDKHSIVGIADAIKLAIRKGANAINLSISQVDKKKVRAKFEAGDIRFIGHKEGADKEFLEGISFALGQGVPVFIAGGNDKEELDNDPFIADIIKTTKLDSNSDLLVFAGGFNYPEEAFDRNDLYFAEWSARCGSGSDYSRYLITGPYKVNGVKGTSFASPAIMGVYLLLREFCEKERATSGIGIEPKEILACMRGSAFNKPMDGEQENPDWYGCGVIDAGSALATCKDIVEARKAFKAGHFDRSLDIWKKVILKIGQYSPLQFVIEAAKCNPQGLPDVLSEIDVIVNLYPNLYSNHSFDRREALRCFIIGDFEASKKILCNMVKQLPKKVLKHPGIELELRHKVYSTTPGTIRKSFDGWLKSFLIHELRRVYKVETEQNTGYVEGHSNETKSLSLDVRGGFSLFHKLLNSLDQVYGDSQKETGRCYPLINYELEVTSLERALKQFVIPAPLLTRYNWHLSNVKKNAHINKG